MTEFVAMDLQQVIASENSASQCMSSKICDRSATAMNTSLASTLDDSTPSDSGIQLLDSVSSMNASLMSNSGFEFDLTQKSLDDDEGPTPALHQLPDLLLASFEPNTNLSTVAMEVDVSDNLAATIDAVAHIPDEMKTSVCSTFDAEPIVYRRKTKKTHQNSAGGPKKRVSFHEDILKNTKTDNIHIEHGFITYKGYSNKQQQPVSTGRYSWCPEGAAGHPRESASNHTGDDDEESENTQYYYRNACSDVLDYGKTDLYEKEIPGECV